MLYWILAQIVVLIHLAFICFVVLGGLLCFKWRYLMVLHVPAVIWGILIEINGWLCPLTPLEKWLRHMAGQQHYSGGFIEHYLLPLIYPVALDRDLQLILAAVVILTNGIIYTLLIRKIMMQKRN